MKKISICITYYNQKEFVKQSLDSVLSIDYPCDFEILCGDDGSTDGTLDVVKEYAQEYPNNIKYFVMDRDNSPKSINRASLNRLNLAKNANGDYIMFLDGDDFYCDVTFVKEALQVFEKNEKVEVCAFNFEYLHPDNTVEIYNQKMTVGLIDNKKYISTGAYTPSGACIFKNILNEERFELLEKINNFDDNAITIYFLQFGDLYYFDKSIYVYRQTNNSLWNSVNNIEQDLLNAFDYKLICDSAPLFKKEIAKRQYGAIRKVYKNRKNLQKQLGENFERYLTIAQKNNDNFMEDVLRWNNSKYIKKIKIVIRWYMFKQFANTNKTRTV